MSAADAWYRDAATLRFVLRYILSFAAHAESMPRLSLGDLTLGLTPLLQWLLLPGLALYAARIPAPNRATPKG